MSNEKKKNLHHQTQTMVSIECKKIKTTENKTFKKIKKWNSGYPIFDCLKIYYMMKTGQRYILTMCKFAICAYTGKHIPKNSAL